jgi:hypothetical protein
MNIHDRDRRDREELDRDLARRRGETFWNIMPGEVSKPAKNKPTTKDKQ